MQPVDGIWPDDGNDTIAGVPGDEIWGQVDARFTTNAFPTSVDSDWIRTDGGGWGAELPPPPFRLANIHLALCEGAVWPPQQLADISIRVEGEQVGQVSGEWRDTVIVRMKSFSASPR